MIYLVLLGITFLIQLFAASWYCLAKTNKLDKVFKYKILCSGIYIADILLCGAMANSFANVYYYIILLGMMLTFTADVIEDKSKISEKAFAVLRTLSSFAFLCGVIYQETLQFGLPIFTKTYSIIAVLCAVIVFAILLLNDRSIKAFKLLPVASSFLFFLISLVFGISLQLTNKANMQTLSCILIMSSGAIFFSDYFHFGKNKEAKLLLRTNIYYFALMIFSCSVANI